MEPAGGADAAGYEITATEEDEPDIAGEAGSSDDTVGSAGGRPSAAGQADEAPPVAAGGGAGGGGDIAGPPPPPGEEMPSADGDPEPRPEAPPEVLTTAYAMIEKQQAPVEPQDYDATAQRVGELLVEQDAAWAALRAKDEAAGIQGAARDVIATQEVPMEDAGTRAEREAQVAELVAEHDAAREAFRAHDPDDDIEPTDRPEAPAAPETQPVPDMPPAIEVGAVVRYQDGELQDGADPNYFDPDMPEVVYAPADSIVMARGGPGQDNLAVNASSEGCRIVTLHNGQTLEIGVVHIGAEDAGTNNGEQLIQTAMDTMPSLAWAGVQAHVFGDVETSPLGEEAGRWNGRLETFLHGKGIGDVTVVSERDGKDVYAYANTGQVEAFDVRRVRIYPPETPEVQALHDRHRAQPPETRPDNAEPTET
jgi:hypothetical protein